MEEIKRTAVLWGEYWQQAEGGKGAATLRKIAQAQTDTFSWTDVIAWELRG